MLVEKNREKKWSESIFDFSIGMDDPNRREILNILESIWILLARN
jgi:hypothetical protein